MMNMSLVHFRFVLALFLLIVITGCAALPADQARGTPARQIASQSLFSVQANGVTVGAAVVVPCEACGGPVIITSGHVARQAGDGMELRRADGGEPVAAALIATSNRIDLAVLRVLDGSARPAAVAEDMPSRGAPVWALGPQGLGRAIAAGRVQRAALRMRNFGPGFTAAMGALMGFSGGPVVDGRGQVVGLTTALTNPGAAPVLAALTGFDLDGVVNGESREVFVLSIQAIEAELERLAPR